ncbi:hypothetical protein [Serratia sp. 2723]|uniref:hypothetical protein n=1 Tax=unclassified Serratia (in: enterobacteria) TaxID=2647522 RepID=UPI003D1FC645
MKKVNDQKAMAVVGGAMGCVQVYHKMKNAEGEDICNISVACEDKWGNTTTSSKPVKMDYCAE